MTEPSTAGRAELGGQGRVERRRGGGGGGGVGGEVGDAEVGEDGRRRGVVQQVVRQQADAPTSSHGPRAVESFPHPL